MVSQKKHRFRKCNDYDRPVAGLCQLRPYEFCQMRRQQPKGLLQGIEALRFLVGGFIYVELAIDLDLQTVAILDRASYTRDQRHAFERIIACHRVAAPTLEENQRGSCVPAHQIDERPNSMSTRDALLGCTPSGIEARRRFAWRCVT